MTELGHQLLKQADHDEIIDLTSVNLVILLQHSTYTVHDTCF